MAGNKIFEYKEEKWRRQRYCEQGLTQAEIAERCEVSQPTISYYVNKFGLEQPARKPHHEEDWLREKYIVERMSMTEIAALCDVSVGAISKKVRRSAVESEGVRGDRNPMYGRPPANAR